MKATTAILLLLLAANLSHAQIFKKLGDKIKRDAEWRIRSKADQQVARGIDSVIAAPKKIKDKKKEKNNTAENTVPATTNNNTAKNNTPQPATNLKESKPDPNDMTPKDGFISLSLSSEKAYTGFGISIGIRITGESVKYKNFNQVQVVVSGPSTKDVRQLQLTADGKFYLDWNPSDQSGDFTVTATSSDKKASKSATFSVESFDLPDYDDWPKENKKETKKALETLEDAVEQAEDGISPADKDELQKKLDDVKEKVEDLYQLFNDLGKANKQMIQLAKKEKRLPPNYAGYLAELNRTLEEQASQMKKLNETAVHKPQDNTICEHLVMVNEACAAFSTFTGATSKVIKTIIANIISDKAAPKPTDAANTPEATYKFFPKEVYNIYGIANKDADLLSTKLAKVSFAGDLAQYASEVLLKKYCGIIKGEIKHDYTINFRNGKGVSWWKYGAEMQGAIVLRYPKEGSKGKIIKMKGNIEGNATKFSFYENAEANDDFNEGTKGKIEVVELKVIKPATVPFVSSLNDPAGFGAVARGLTPASFYITVDAEYDVDANTIKIFFNNALMDFSDAVNNQLIFLEVGADLLPYIKKMTFPIAKVFSTFGSVVRSNNEFVVTKGPKGSLSFTKKANKHLGDKSSKIEHDLNYTITASKE
ncbi:MCP four helix bundle domain-containing protein [Ferruginibacter profundus]